MSLFLMESLVLSSPRQRSVLSRPLFVHQNTCRRGTDSLLQIVDFAIWLLFSRGKAPGSRPKHLLCDGFRKGVGQRQQRGPTSGESSIPGLSATYHNGRVAAIKESPWPQLLTLLGQSGESIMIDLLLDCSIFLHVESGQGNYYQLSGMSVFDSEPLSSQTASLPEKPVLSERKSTEIVFVRSRMMYARAALNARGSVSFGLRHIRERFLIGPRICQLT